MIAIISIHALTWRATDVKLPKDKPLPISIHALTWRATVAQVDTPKL